MKELKTYTKDNMRLRALIQPDWQVIFALDDLLDTLPRRNRNNALKQLKYVKIRFKADQPPVLMVNKPDFWRLILSSKSKKADCLRTWVQEEIIPDLYERQRYEELWVSAYEKYPKYFITLCKDWLNERKEIEKCEAYQSDLRALVSAHPESCRYAQQEDQEVSEKLYGLRIKESLYWTGIQAELQIAFENKKKEAECFFYTGAIKNEKHIF